MESMVPLSAVLTISVPILAAVVGTMIVHTIRHSSRTSRLEGWVEAYETGIGASITRVEESIKTLREESTAQHNELAAKFETARGEGSDKRRELHGQIRELSERVTAIEARGTA